MDWSNVPIEKVIAGIVIAAIAGVACLVGAISEEIFKVIILAIIGLFAMESVGSTVKTKILCKCKGKCTCK